MPFTKGTKRAAPRDSRSDSEDEVITKSNKKTKTAKNGASTDGVDKDGNPFWDVSFLLRPPTSVASTLPKKKFTPCN